MKARIPIAVAALLETSSFIVPGTAAIVNEAAAPISTVLDETYKIAITRFDECLPSHAAGQEGKSGRRAEAGNNEPAPRKVTWCKLHRCFDT